MEPPVSFELTIQDLYDLFEAKLHRYAVNLARDSDRADDLVQETLIRAMGNLVLLQQLHPHQRQAWMYRVLKNLFIDGQRRRERQEVLYEQLAWKAELETAPATTVLAQDMIDLVPERYRDVLLRRYILGQTSDEIGKAYRIPAATVRSRLYLARKWLRAHHPELES
jgi:RNA polymerase sigma-70 factor (ECF subfamily)